ncbi:MAG TPA: DUF4402 domain-containing protein [Verrucomicrobiae bacterium]|nr:DUF4402 domain-containing protein [Verrucomicrobiae bacterium]
MRALRLLATLALLAPCAGHPQSLYLINHQGLSFGRFAAGSGGTVTVTPTGARSSSGPIYLLSASSGQEARYTITGGSDLAYSITLPADDSVTLSSGTGPTMVVTRFTSGPASTGQFGPTGAQAIAVGATLNISANQPAGNYGGSYSITVNYN